MAARWRGRTTAWALACLLLVSGTAADQRRQLGAASTGDGSDGTLALVPTREVMYGHDVFYQMPTDPIGTVAFFHGCGGDFWPPSSKCPASTCRGLPEEIAHTKQALARGYAVIAISSADRTPGSMCFSWSADADDVASILHQFTSDMGLASLPLYVVGVSSGGAFALKIPRPLTVNGVVAEAIGVNSGDWSMEDARPSYPPTVFLDMLKDQVYEKKLYPSYFSDRSPFLTPDLSAKVVQGLKDIGMASEDGLLLKDPRYTKGWQAKLQEAVPELASTNDLVPDAGQASSGGWPASAGACRADGAAPRRGQGGARISESMNVADAEYLTASLVWLESRGKLNMNDVLSQYQIFGPESELTADRLPAGAKPAVAGPQAPQWSPPPPVRPPPPVASPPPPVAVPIASPPVLAAAPVPASAAAVPGSPTPVPAPAPKQQIAKLPPGADQVSTATVSPPGSAALPATSLLTAAAAVLVPVLLKRFYLQQA
eukprot:scaffold15.g4278.t1